MESLVASALSTKNLNKRFGSLVVAQDISLELPEGVRYALIGPNGAGKTTLMNLLTGMLQPDSGAVFLGGEDVTALRPDKRVKRGKPLCHLAKRSPVASRAGCPSG